MRKKNKKGFEFSFVWLFSIIIGAIIIFLAIYAASKFIKTSRYEIDTVTAKQLSIIFEPLETGLASGKSNKAVLKEETRIYNKCFFEGKFGEHYISLSTKQGIGEAWQEPGGEIAVPNKYVFSQDIEQGKEIFFFSKVFEMPWKVSELIFLTTEKYCFVDAPERIEEEVNGLNLENIRLGDCSKNEIEVCFGQGSCEIEVIGLCKDYDCENEYEYGYVIKNGEKVFYAGSLMYGAVFSSKDIYGCNVKRLMKRLVQQALLYKEEAVFLTGKCGSLPDTGLLQIIQLASSYENPEDLLLVWKSAGELDEQNSAAECSLW